MIKLLKQFFGGASADLKQLAANGAIIVDVRSASEYRSGHIPGSRNYPLDTIRSRVTELKNLNKPVITVCQSGARSGMAKNVLKAAGVEAYNGGPWSLLKKTIA